MWYSCMRDVLSSYDLAEQLDPVFIMLHTLCRSPCNLAELVEHGVMLRGRMVDRIAQESQ